MGAASSRGILRRMTDPDTEKVPTAGREPSDDEVPAAVTKRRSPLVAFIPIVVIGVVVTVFIMAQPSLEGSFMLTEPGGSPDTRHPTYCESGDGARPSFLGAFVHDNRGDAWRVDQGSIRLERPDDPLVLSPSTCEQFDVELDWGAVSVNRVEPVDGAVRARCSVDGRDVEIALDFDNCTTR